MDILYTGFIWAYDVVDNTSISVNETFPTSISENVTIDALNDTFTTPFYEDNATDVFSTPEGNTTECTDLTTTALLPTQNTTLKPDDKKKNIARLELPVLLAYNILSLIGVTGNVLVILAIICLRRLRTAYNVYVVNLCIADIFLGLNAFILVKDIWYQNWAAANGVCGLFSFMTAFPPVAIVGSMLCIALNRHTAIVESMPMAQIGVHLRQRRLALYHSAILWSIAIVLCLPVLVEWVSSRAGLFCACCIYFTENVIYSIVLTGSVYILPNLVIIVLYVRIFLHVRHSRMRILEHHQRTADTMSVLNYDAPLKRSRSFRLSSDLRVAIQFLVLFLVFNICYFPPIIYFWKATQSRVDSPMRGVVTILFALNIILNPLCYFCLNSSARAEVYRACAYHCSGKCCGTGRKRDTITSEVISSRPPTPIEESIDKMSKGSPWSRSPIATKTYKSSTFGRPPSGHSLKTVSELNLPENGVFTDGSNITIRSPRWDTSPKSPRSPNGEQQRSRLTPRPARVGFDEGNVYGTCPSMSGVGVLPAGGSTINTTDGADTYDLREESEYCSSPSEHQRATGGGGPRKLPLIRRPESLDVNILCGDSYI